MTAFSGEDRHHRGCGLCGAWVWRNGAQVKKSFEIDREMVDNVYIIRRYGYG